MTQSVNRRLLKLLSRVLELPDEWLWDNVQSHGSPVGDGYFRHALFYPLLGEDKELATLVKAVIHNEVCSLFPIFFLHLGKFNLEL